jgi:hypothetical protein
VYILYQRLETQQSTFSARDKLIIALSQADIKCSNMAGRLLASRNSSVGGAAASRANETMTSRITSVTTALPTRTSNNTVPPSVVATTNDSVSEMGTNASAVYLNQQRSNDFILTNEQLLGIVSKNVRLELFHLVKFITSPSELSWGEPIQRWIFKKVNFSEDKSLKDFWAKHSRCVRLALNKKRGNVSTEVKACFMSKSIISYPLTLFQTTHSYLFSFIYITF